MQLVERSQATTDTQFCDATPEVVGFKAHIRVGGGKWVDEAAGASSSANYLAKVAGAACVAGCAAADGWVTVELTSYSDPAALLMVGTLLEGSVLAAVYEPGVRVPLVNKAGRFGGHVLFTAAVCAAPQGEVTLPPAKPTAAWKTGMKERLAGPYSLAARAAKESAWMIGLTAGYFVAIISAVLFLVGGVSWVLLPPMPYGLICGGVIAVFFVTAAECCQFANPTASPPPRMESWWRRYPARVLSVIFALAGALGVGWMLVAARVGFLVPWLGLLFTPLIVCMTVCNAIRSSRDQRRNS